MGASIDFGVTGFDWDKTQPGAGGLKVQCVEGGYLLVLVHSPRASHVLVITSHILPSITRAHLATISKANNLQAARVPPFWPLQFSSGSTLSKPLLWRTRHQSIFKRWRRSHVAAKLTVSNIVLWTSYSCISKMIMKRMIMALSKMIKTRKPSLILFIL